MESWVTRSEAALKGENIDMSEYYDIDYRSALRRMLSELESLKISESKASKALVKTRKRISQLEKVTSALQEMVGDPIVEKVEKKAATK